MHPLALTIAGSDPSGGAGVAVDIKTFSALGVYGAYALTLITIQNTRGVIEAHPLPPSIVARQIEAVVSDMGVDAVKTGALGTREIVETVASKLSTIDAPLVVDPVMAAAAGGKLLEEDAVKALRDKLIPIAKIVTPNRFEAEKLTGMVIRGIGDAIEAAKRLARETSVEAVVVKGGHIEASDAIDILYYKGSVRLLRAPRVETRCRHGLGCSFSAAITAALARKLDIVEAVKLAKKLATMALKYPVERGSGNCPIDVTAPMLADAERMRAVRDVEKAVEKVLSKSASVSRYAPEVGINIVEAIPYPYAKSLEDVVGVEGRIVRLPGNRLKQVGPVKPGASSHLARLVLSIMKHHPSIRAAVNIAYHRDLVEAAARLGYRILRVDRRLEPTKTIEGGTMVWIAEQTASMSSPPDIIYDEGDVGKEPMIRILGLNALDAVDKLLRIVEEAARS